MKRRSQLENRKQACNARTLTGRLPEFPVFSLHYREMGRDEFARDSLRLYKEPFQVALPLDHRLTQSAKLKTADLTSDEMLLLSEGHCLRDQVLDVCHAQTADGTPNIRETSLETILALVAAGDGITMVPILALPANGGMRGIKCLETSEDVGRFMRLV